MCIYVLHLSHGHTRCNATRQALEDRSRRERLLKFMKWDASGAKIFWATSDILRSWPFCANMSYKLSLIDSISFLFLKTDDSGVWLHVNWAVLFCILVGVKWLWQRMLKLPVMALSTYLTFGHYKGDMFVLVCQDHSWHEACLHSPCYSRIT